MEFLKIENLCKVYGRDENQVIALDHVSLTIEKGEFTAIIVPPVPANPHCFTPSPVWTYRQAGRCI